jgi:hypothetical protein
MRMSGLEDIALPLTLVFAVAFTLTLRHEMALPSPATAAIAATESHPDYVMTITAKRLPPGCRAAPHASPCQKYLAGEARVEMREGDARLAARAAPGDDAR